MNSQCSRGLPVLNLENIDRSHADLLRRHPMPAVAAVPVIRTLKNIVAVSEILNHLEFSDHFPPLLQWRSSP